MKNRESVFHQNVLRSQIKKLSFLKSLTFDPFKRLLKTPSP